MAISSNAKQLSYSLISNGINLMVSVLSTLLIPRLFGAEIEQYGYYQLYLFYSVYVGFFHFGWCDGILLKEGGKQYSDLDKSLYSRQLRMLMVLEVIIAIGIITIVIPNVNDSSKSFVLLMLALNIIILMPRSMLQYLLQSTGRIKEYSIMLITSRVFFIVSTIIILSFGFVNYKYIICCDIVGKLIGLYITAIYCSDIIAAKPCKLKKGLCESGNNIAIGLSLLFSNIASQLVSGIVKFGIERAWGVAVFGKVSLSVSISSMLMTFATAVSVVLYPMLRRIPKDKVSSTYQKIRNTLMMPVLGVLVLYYPVQIVMSMWLPQYADSLRYMAILFPVCIYSAKMLLLISTFLKSLRCEKQLLLINGITVLCSILSTTISVVVVKSLDLAILSILLNEIVKCTIAEIYISKKLKVQFVKNISCEFTLTIMFIIANWVVSGWCGFLMYVIAYAAYLIIERKEAIDLFNKIIKRSTKSLNANNKK